MSKLNYWFSQSCAVFVNFNFFIGFFFQLHYPLDSYFCCVKERKLFLYHVVYHVTTKKWLSIRGLAGEMTLCKSVQSNLERFLQNSGTHPTTAGNNDYEMYTSWNKMQPPSTDRNKKHISITSNNKSKFNLNSLEKLWVSLHAHERMQNL